MLAGEDLHGRCQRLVDKRFSPSGGTVIQYYNDAANNEMHLDTEKLRTLGFSLKDVASFLESQGFLVAVYTEDDVRIALATDTG